MKLHTERNEVERSGVGNETAFHIKTTAKAFDILSSGLYTDNILAVVRELSCNAHDAHVAAGKGDVPFEIHLPNNLEPWFHVKDNGIGLSDDQVMGLYTTYFDSTKTDSNEYIGALGLGSKSPFSYTNAFEVISRYEGMRRVYSVFINEDGVPTIAKMGEVVTDEPNGVEVRIAVKDRDFAVFVEKTASALKWFATKPTVIGRAHFRFEEIPECRVNGTNWQLLPRKYSDPQMTAVQGNVAYVVNLNQLNLDFNLGAETQKLLSEGHLVCFFEIGELEVAASREEIRYDKRSVEALTVRIDNFRKEAVNQIEKQVNQLKQSFWYNIIELNNLSTKLFGNENGIRTFVKGRTKNPTLKKYCEVRQSWLEFPPLCGYEVFTYARARYHSNSKLSRTRTTGIKPVGDLAVFINDVKIGGVSRLHKFIETSHYNTAMVIRKKKNASFLEESSDGTLVPHYLTEKEYEDELKILINNIGNPNVKTVSADTPKPTKKKNRSTRPIPVFTYGGAAETRYYYRDSRIDWSRVNSSEFNFEKGGLYFGLKNSSRIVAPPKSADGEPILVRWSPALAGSNIQTMITLVHKHFPNLGKFTLDRVYAMGAQMQRKAEKADNWFNIFDLIRTIVPKYEDAILFSLNQQASPDILGIKHIIDADDNRCKQFVAKIKALDTDSAFRKTFEPMIDAASSFFEARQFISLLRHYDEKYGDELFTKKKGKPYYNHEIINTYPMLSFINNCYEHYRYASKIIANDPFDNLFDYIKLIDRR